MEETVKKFLTAILVVLCINTVLLSALVFGGGSSSPTSKENDNTTTSEEYDTSKVEAIDYARFEELYRGKEKAIVLFARESCGYCVQFMPVLNAAIEKHGLKVYYLDITTMTEENVTSIQALDSFFEENYGYTPTLAVVSDGKVVANNVGYVDADGLDSFLTENSLVK